MIDTVAFSNPNTAYRLPQTVSALFVDSKTAIPLLGNRLLGSGPRIVYPHFPAVGIPWPSRGPVWRHIALWLGTKKSTLEQRTESRSHWCRVIAALYTNTTPPKLLFLSTCASRNSALASRRSQGRPRTAANRQSNLPRHITIASRRFREL